MNTHKKFIAIAGSWLFLWVSSAMAQTPGLDWVRTISGSDTLGNADDRAMAVTHDISGNILITGSFHGTADLDPGSGVALAHSVAYNTIFLLKLNAAGDFVFARSFGEGIGTAIATDASGNIYMTGHYYGTVDFDPGPQVSNLTAAGQIDVFVVKLGPAGNLIWARSSGGGGDDQALGIACDALGNVYTTGYFEGTADFDPGSGVQTLISAGDLDIFVSKLSTNGNFIWARRLGGSGQENGNAIAVNPATFDVFVTGWFEGAADFDPGTGTHQFVSAGNLDIFVLKLDVSGNFVWARQFGGTSTDRGNAITMDPSGSGALIVAGSYYSTIDFDPGAGTSNHASLGQYDVFALKMDQAGNHIWSRSMGGVGFDYCYAVAADGNGNVYLTGQFSGTSHDYDPGTGVYSLTGNDDVFFVNLNLSGQFMWGGSTKGPSGDIGLGISVSSTGEPCIAGSFGSTVDFDPGPGVHDVANSYFLGIDVFVMKLKEPTSGAPETGASAVRPVFPNPCEDIFHIVMEEEGAIEVIDLLGKVVYTGKLSRGQNDVGIAGFPAGLYSIAVSEKAAVNFYKLVKL